MAALVKRLTHLTVTQTFAGSNPVGRPIEIKTRLILVFFIIIVVYVHFNDFNNYIFGFFNPRIKLLLLI